MKTKQLFTMKNSMYFVIIIALLFFLLPSLSYSEELWKYFNTSKILNVYNKTIGEIVISPDNIKYFTSLASGPLIRYDNIEWQLISIGDPISGALAFDNNTLLIGADPGGYYTYNGLNVSFYSVSRLHPEWKYGSAVRSLLVDDDGILWIVFFGGREFRGGVVSYDGQDYSNHFPVDTIWRYENHLFYIAKDKNNNIWVTSTYGLFYYDRKEWKMFTMDDGLPKNYLGEIVIDRNDVKWIALGNFLEENYGFVRYDGETWTWYTVENSGLPSNKVRPIAVDQNNVIWIGTWDAGVCRFDGKTWTIFNTQNSGLCSDEVYAIAVEKNNTIWFGTDNGISRYTGEVITLPSDVDETEPEAVPLLKAYPNPFNPTTTIEFILPDDGFTTITIYNMEGQKVRELAAKRMNAGTHRLQWDGKNGTGSSVSAGVYIARLKTGDLTAAGKLVLVK